LDCDGDGWIAVQEIMIYGASNTSNDQDPCGLNGWPATVYDLGISANTLDIVDVTSFVAPVRRLDTSPPEPNFSARWDLKPGAGAFPKYINITDITALVSGPTGNPPMFQGARAFGKVCPWP
jgi:hypothetical protein